MSTPLLFERRHRTGPTQAVQYVGTDTEMDPKDSAPPLAGDRSVPQLHGRRRQMAAADAAQYAGTDTEADPKAG